MGLLHAAARNGTSPTLQERMELLHAAARNGTFPNRRNEWNFPTQQYLDGQVAWTAPVIVINGDERQRAKAG